MLKFAKYQGTGNDFIMIDNRNGDWNDLPISAIQKLCDRKFGIGADGLIKINSHESLDFEVDYYNSDGSKSFCGNGARCSVQFAHSLGITSEHVTFLAIDGVHQAWKKNDLIELEMLDVDHFLMDSDSYVIHTGSPHFVSFINEIDSFDILSYGQEIRYNETYEAMGINVNAIEKKGAHRFAIRTYERGVEAETLSCGTGVTASAIAFALNNDLSGELTLTAETQGGICKVELKRRGNHFTEVKLIGPATFIFNGEIDGDI